MEEKFFDLRYDRVSKAKEFRHLDKLDIKSFTEKVDERYTDSFQEGTMQLLWMFCAQRKLPFKESVDGDRERLLDYIEEKFPSYTVSTNPDGLDLVEMPDEPDRGSFRYRRGMKDIVLQRHTIRE